MNEKKELKEREERGEEIENIPRSCPDLCIQYVLNSSETPMPVINKLRADYPHIEFVTGFQPDSDVVY